MVRYIADDEDEFRTLQEPSPTAYLVHLVGGKASQTFPLRREVTLGRERGNAIVVADHKVSRHHARLAPIDNTFIISDLGSANGTYINGVLIAQPTRLQNNDRIGIGDTIFLFTTSEPDPQAVEASPAPVSPAPRQSEPPQSPPASDRVPGVRSFTNQPPSIWVLIGCMALIIVVLLFVLAVMLGLFVGRGQVTGLVPLGALLQLLGG